MYKALDLWLPAYLRRRRFVMPKGTTDILIAVCDHFEPLHHADKTTALARIRAWKREFPGFIESFADADGCQPRHTFFYPIEQYDPDLVGELAELCARSGSEAEIHLHHEGDTAEGLRAKLERGKADLARHGLLSRDEAGNIRYGFIHGNWALANSHPHGCHCGVNDELTVLAQTGCYADFTMPSAPNSAQTRIINSLYYAHSNGRSKPHDTGELACVGSASSGPPSTFNDRLLLVQGPLGLNWERRKFGLLPRIENSELSAVNPPRLDRMRVWTRLGIHVQGQPEWLFIKLHTHGGIPQNHQMLLGEPMRQFHQFLAQNYRENAGFRLHYVTAREMTNMLHAAEAGHRGNPGRFRDFRFRSSLSAGLGDT